MTDLMYVLLTCAIAVWTLLGVFYIYVGHNLLRWLDRRPGPVSRYQSSADAKEEPQSRAVPVFDATAINEQLDRNKADRNRNKSEDTMEVHEGNMCEEVILEPGKPLNRTMSGI